jgi:hypothetical protein
MAIFKNTSNDYTITVAGGYGIFTVNAANIRLNGNVTQTGNTTVSIPFFTVAANNTGVITDMGLLGQTGPTTFAGLRFNTVANAWQISSSVTSGGVPIASYANIATGNASAAGSNTQIQFNQSGAFAASANLTFDTANNQLQLAGHQTFVNTATPVNTANAVAVYSNVPGGGGTGLYFTSAAASDELVSKSKAIVYGIIF